LTLFYLPVFFLASLLFLLYVPFHFLVMRGFLRRKRADAGRVLNWLYGRWLTACGWPCIRVERVGTENIPTNESFVAVANHRSFVDIFFCTHIPRPNTEVVLRSWPFRIPVLNIFMRLADYVNIEKHDIDQLIQYVGEQKRRDNCFVFFPEGHRSRDGRLHHFRSGAFKVAAANRMPVVPVVFQGTEAFGRGVQTLRPTTVKITILPPVRPEDMGDEKQALRLRRKVQNIFREYLGETVEPAEE
jgi:1-acyl-sn-glycerol-3-phosphate acyltransferase